MRNLLSILASLSIFTASTQALAGGVIPQGLGMYDDGRSINLVPASSSMIRWRSYGSLTPENRDTIMWAVASVDVETQEFALLWADAGEADAGQVELFFSGKSDPLWPECSDATAGGCTYASTTCLTKTRQGSFELCSAYRVNLYMENIVFGAQKRNIPVHQFLTSIVRHETGHVLGLSHFDPGPMTSNHFMEPFSPCQHALWMMFHIDPAVTTWSYPPPPASCQ